MLPHTNHYYYDELESRHPAKWTGIAYDKGLKVIYRKTPLRRKTSMPMPVSLITSNDDFKVT